MSQSTSVIFKFVQKYLSIPWIIINVWEEIAVVDPFSGWFVLTDSTEQCKQH